MSDNVHLRHIEVGRTHLTLCGQPIEANARITWGGFWFFGEKKLASKDGLFTCESCKRRLLRRQGYEFAPDADPITMKHLFKPLEQPEQVFSEIVDWYTWRREFSRQKRVSWLRATIDVLSSF